MLSYANKGEDNVYARSVKIRVNNIYTKNIEIYTWNSNVFGLHLHCRQVPFDPSVINGLIL